MSYACAIEDGRSVTHLHWGARLPNVDELTAPVRWDLSPNDPVAQLTPEEYPCHGGFRYKEQCLAVTLSDGTRELDVRYQDHAVRADSLVIHLGDPIARLNVTLHYRVIEELDLIQRWAVINNDGSESIELTAVASAEFHIDREDLDLSNVHGMWGAEQQSFRQAVGYGKVVLEGRRGISSHHHNPYAVLDADATETDGEVFFAALEYGGNFKVVAEQSPYRSTSLTLGINDYDFGWKLAAGESFETPRVVAGYSSTGRGTMSHHLHRYARELMHNPRIRPVLYNSWEATGFNVTEQNQRELARLAAPLGVELFVVDDGWFGQRASQLDGLGDWYVNPDKFPDGLTPLIDEVKALGMDFGIWIEPEMVNPPTRLYAEHPDWIHHTPGRDTQTSRDQWVLNVALPEVQEFIFTTIADLLANNRIAYLKWDANRPMAGVGADSSVWHRHMLGVYDIVDRLRVAHPGVLIEACASGGGRIDMGTLAHFDDFWTSDNTDALDRLTIQRGYSFIYPAKAMRAWVTDSPNFLTGRAIPLPFRFHVAMMGSLGIGMDLRHVNDVDLATATAMVETYRRIRPIVADGDVYRLSGGLDQEYWAVQYVQGTSALLFVLRPVARIGRRPLLVRLRGLDPAATYRYRIDASAFEHTGAYLMSHGVEFSFYGDFSSRLVEFES